MRYLGILKNHWLVVVMSTVVAAALAVGLSFIPDQLYESEVDLLIVQKQNVGSDAYTTQRAAEKLGNNLVNVVYSLDFQNRVFTTGKVRADQFSSSPKENKEEWETAVKAQVIPETGIIRVFGYAVDPLQAEDIALGVSAVLMNNASDYHGGGDSVAIKQIDGPITSGRPVKPNIILNGVAAAVLGFMVVYTYFLLQTESQRLAEEKHPLPDPLQATIPKPTYRVLDHFPVPSVSDEPVTLHDHYRATNQR